MWSWAAEVADGSGGAGVSDDGQRAMDAAGEWLLANGAATAVLEQVRLATETADLSGCYRPAGLRLAARVRNGRVTWVPAAADAGSDDRCFLRGGTEDSRADMRAVTWLREDQAAGGDAGAGGYQEGAVAGDLVDGGAAELADRLGDAVHAVDVRLAQLAAVRVEREAAA